MASTASRAYRWLERSLAPQTLETGPWRRFVLVSDIGRLVVVVVVVATVWATSYLPPSQQARFLVVVGGIGVPFTIAALVLRRRDLSFRTQAVVHAGDLASVFAAQIIAPEVRPIAALAYLYIVVFVAPIGGLPLAGVVVVLAAGLTLLAEAVTPSVQPFDWTLFGVWTLIAAGLGAIVDAATREWRAIAATRESTLSHEMRSPLTAIQGFAEILLDRGEHLGPRDRRDFLRAIVRNTSVLQRTVDAVFDLSRIEGRGLPVDLGPVEMRAFLDEIEFGYRPMLEPGGVTVHCPDGVVALADRDLLEHVVVNLLVNAVRHSKAADPIELRAEHVGAGRIAVSVRDHGPGVAPEHASRIFEPFWRAEHRGARGAGIGLWLVRRFVEALGGGIRVESPPGGGARFVADLPAVREPSPDRWHVSR